MARDRKRAKQRRERRARTSVPASTPQRADVPGALDHASADVDEFDAALVSGAAGVAATPEAVDASEPGVRDGSEDELGPGPGEVRDQVHGGGLYQNSK